MFHDLKIIGNGKSMGSKVYLDGVEVRGVTSVEFKNAVDEIPYLKLELFVGTHEIVENTEEENNAK